MVSGFNQVWRWTLFSVVLAFAAVGLIVTSAHPATAALIAVLAIAIGWVWSRATRTKEAGRESAAVAHLSHELRTPLTSVLGLLEVLRDQSVILEPGEMEELIGLAHSGALHMNHVVGNFLVSSRISQNLLVPNLEALDPGSLVEEALHRMPSVEKRTFVSRQDSHPIHADPAFVLQILLNLLQNVERYAPEGEVEIAFATIGDEVILSMSDDGPGLPVSPAFKDESSEFGLGLGLSLSRTLARLMGGDLRIAAPRRSGATLNLILPASTESPAPPDAARQETDRSVALSPRARLLVDMTEALSDRSLDRVVMGLRKLCIEILDARSAILAIPNGSSGFERAGSFVDDGPAPLDSNLFHSAMEVGSSTIHEDLAGTGAEALAAELGGNAALLVPVLDGGTPVGVFVIGWATSTDLPGEQGRAVATALAQLAAFAIDRSTLVEDVVFERELRASVMESLPLAITVFVGDPPRLVDWNRRELEMLGIDDDSMRPSDLEKSQRLFDVRFADGTPLDVDSAPVTQAIRTGRSTGPFLLRVRRADGTETTTRTYCAPFFDDDGKVIGAVVTSEDLDAAASSEGIGEEGRL